MRSKLPAQLLVAAACLVGCNESSTKATPPVPSSQAPAPASSPAAPAASSAEAPAPKTAKLEDPPPTKIAAQHLLVAYKGAASVPKGVTRTKEEARKRAEEAARRGKAGEDFSALVTEYSDDATKANRGNLGVFTRDKMVKPFSDAAFLLPVDAVSDVVETKFGFHVIKRNQ